MQREIITRVVLYVQLILTNETRSVIYNFVLGLSLSFSLALFSVHWSRPKIPNLPTRGRKLWYRRRRNCRRVITRALNYSGRFYAARRCARSLARLHFLSAKLRKKNSRIALSSVRFDPFTYGLINLSTAAFPTRPRSLISNRLSYSPPLSRPFRSRYVSSHYHISHTSRPSYLTLPQNSLTLAVNTSIFLLCSCITHAHRSPIRVSF